MNVFIVLPKRCEGRRMRSPRREAIMRQYEQIDCYGRLIDKFDETDNWAFLREDEKVLKMAVGDEIRFTGTTFLRRTT